MSEVLTLYRYINHCPYVIGETYELFLSGRNVDHPDIVFMIFCGIDKFGRMSWKTTESIPYFMRPFVRA